MSSVSASAAVQTVTDDDELLKLLGIVLVGWILTIAPLTAFLTNYPPILPLGPLGLGLLMYLIGPAVLLIGFCAAVRKIVADAVVADT